MSDMEHKQEKVEYTRHFFRQGQFSCSVEIGGEGKEKGIRISDADQVNGKGDKYYSSKERFLDALAVMNEVAELLDKQGKS